MQDHAYLTIARIDGDPDDLLGRYEEVADTMDGVGTTHGLLANAVARSEAGVTIVNLWPTPAHADRASGDERRLDTLRRLGISPADFRREHLSVVRHFIPGA